VTILSDFEDRVGRAIEGVFSGVFRSPVQPAELARAAAKEMDRRKKLGVGKVYAPTMYSILLSAEDADQLGGFTDTMAGELETYLLGYARERDYELPHRPRVRFLVDEALKLGRFEVIGELLSPEEIALEFAGFEDADEVVTPAVDAPAAQPAPAVFDAEAALAETVDDTFAPDDAFPLSDVPGVRIATVTVPGIAHDVVLQGDRMSVGRLGTCDIVLKDANTSREHFALQRDGDGWALVDLGSLNGTLINNTRVQRKRLVDGDIITAGVTQLVYHEPGS